MSQYLHENPKAGNFNPQRKLSGLLVVIQEHLASIRAIDLLCEALCVRRLSKSRKWKEDV